MGMSIEVSVETVWPAGSSGSDSSTILLDVPKAFIDAWVEIPLYILSIPNF